MNGRNDRELSRNLRPCPPRVWYGLAVLTLIVGACCLLPLAYALLKGNVTFATVAEEDRG